MKRIAFLLLSPACSALLGLLLTTTPAQAQTSAPVAVEAADAHSIRVRISTATAQPGQVQVLSLTSGRVLFEEAYTAAAYGHRFDFRDLAPGRYALLLKVGATQHRYTLRVQAGPAGSAVALRTIRTRLPKQALAAL